MLLLLVRHAQAAERDDALYPDDAVRPLVTEGRQVQRRVSRRMRKRGLIPQAVLSSPWKRAWQTARIVAREAGLGKGDRVKCAALATDPDLEAIAQAVGPRGDDEVVALVGHEPWMSELASLLLTGSPTRLAIRFPKSGVVGIRTSSIAPANGRLAFFLTPKTV